jgi:serine protease inhibitor ecotin
MTADGRGVANASISMTDSSGVTRQARTSGFGYYRFDDVATGATYVMAVQSKRYQFQPRTVTVGEEISNEDFIAQP